ncbi:MAG: DUF4258 domain-containing protein [Armatimonadota bacterium]
MATTILYRTHAVLQMGARNISTRDVVFLLTDGQVIETYPTDRPFPSRLILGFHQGRALHVVAAYDETTDTEYIITAYEPDPNKWEQGFTQRKR